MENYETLIGYAIQARKRAYVRYSHFAVGAAVMCDDGSVYTGCNIENASYPATICAERVAIANAVNDGKLRIRKIAIVGGRQGMSLSKTAPCGVCRQFLSEFADSNTEIILASEDKGAIKYYLYKMDDLLPDAFRL